MRLLSRGTVWTDRQEEPPGITSDGDMPKPVSRPCRGYGHSESDEISQNAGITLIAIAVEIE